MDSRLMRLFCHPSVVILTTVDWPFTDVEDSRLLSGITLAPSETLTVKNGSKFNDTPIDVSGAVVCSPRLSVKELRSRTLSLKPDPALCYLVSATPEET